MNSMGFETPFQDRIKSYGRPLPSYEPFPEIRSGSPKIPALLRDRLISEGREYLKKPYASILATDYMKFVRTGDRATFEELYFSRRHRLCALITAELVGRDGTFVDEIINGIYCLCEETGWALPAHNSYVRDTPRLILPDDGRPVLDLFSCETAALLSMAYYLLKDQLDRVSESIADYILRRVNERLAVPYLSGHFWWMGNGDEPMCNWTPWCTQNVLLSVFLLPFGDDIRLRVIRQASLSLDCFLKDYGEDGCCDEGAQYYRHAGLCLFHCIEIMNAVTDDTFKDLWSLPKIRNIASYIVNVRACGEYYVNFSDCSAKAGRMGVREFLFGKACCLNTLMRVSAEDVYHDVHSKDPLSDESLKLNLYLRLLTVMYAEEVLDYREQIKDTPFCPPSDIFYPSVGLMVARSGRFILAAKAGDNADNHNHNDTGSFILYLNDKPLFADIGVETYSQKTFSKDRYDIWTMQSGYHNLPTVSGLDQCAGKEYRATEVKCRLEGPEKSIIMHIEKAYPLPDNASYIRSISLDTVSETFTLKDTSECPDVILNFITLDPPAPSGDPDTFLLGDVTVRFSGASILSSETLPITDPRLSLAWDHDLYRIRLRKDSAEFTMSVSPGS